MSRKIPILVTVPNGGYKAPEELLEYHALTDFDLFMQADTCANELFDFEKTVLARIGTPISPLFIDPDRPMTAVPPAATDGVLKSKTADGKDVFRNEMMPDEIAITGLIKRYYNPFHDAVQKQLDGGEVKLLIDCHTMQAVGAREEIDAGKPRPLVLVENLIELGGELHKTCPDGLARSLLDELEKTLADEDCTVAGRGVKSNDAARGYIMRKYGRSGVPLLRLSVSKSLFINDSHFSYEYLRVDELRLQDLRDKIWTAVRRFFLGN